MPWGLTLLTSTLPFDDDKNTTLAPSRRCCEKVGAAMLRGQRWAWNQSPRQSAQLHDSSALTEQGALSLVFNLPIGNMWVKTSTSQVVVRRMNEIKRCECAL